MKVALWYPRMNTIYPGAMGGGNRTTDAKAVIRLLHVSIVLRIVSAIHGKTDAMFSL